MLAYPSEDVTASQKLQPITKPGKSPNAFLVYTYQPPAFGIDVPNSITQSVPKKANIPPAIQVAIIHVEFGRCVATIPGARKIPTPIVPPSDAAIPKPNPRIRSKEFEVVLVIEVKGCVRYYVPPISNNRYPGVAAARRGSDVSVDAFPISDIAKAEPE